MLKVLVVVAVLTLVVYLVARRLDGRGFARPAAPTRRVPPRPVAPDDDPEFLRELERRRRDRARREQARREQAGGEQAGHEQPDEQDRQAGEPEDPAGS